MTSQIGGASSLRGYFSGCLCFRDRTQGLGLVLNPTSKAIVPTALAAVLSPSLDLLPLLGESWMFAAAMFASRCAMLAVPGIGSIIEDFCSNPAQGKLHRVVVATLCLRV